MHENYIRQGNLNCLRKGTTCEVIFIGLRQNLAKIRRKDHLLKIVEALIDCFCVKGLAKCERPTFQFSQQLFKIMICPVRYASFILTPRVFGPVNSTSHTTTKKISKCG